MIGRGCVYLLKGYLDDECFKQCTQRVLERKSWTPSQLGTKLLLVGHLVAVLNMSIKTHSLNCLLGTRLHSIVSELALGGGFLGPL